jgi:sensor histidine kinase YesM
MQVRMGPRLRVELDLPDGLSEVQVPPLLVQPLLENAIQHGLEPTRRGGLLSLHARQSADELWITVRDTGQGLREAAAHQAQAEAGTAARKGGYGLTHVRERLMSLYGGRASLTLMPAEDGPGTLARLTLPLYHSPVLHAASAEPATAPATTPATHAVPHSAPDAPRTNA